MKKSYVSTLKNERNLTDEQLSEILNTDKYDEILFSEADSIRRSIYGDDVYIRGLIEVTNYCKNNCFYCGIRRDNKNVSRYRLSKDEILECCREGYSLGFRTFVLQGGEDVHFTDDFLCDVVSEIRKAYPDCAITLSLGERTYDSYKKLFSAGANRYLLRHEAADCILYGKLHPKEMLLEKRKECLFALKEIGYQVGSGFMVGAPFQTISHIISDIRFLQELEPDMIGIGPYINHKSTPFADYKNGSISLTLRLISILRLLFPYALIPATTALGSLHPLGREMGLRAGANVVMPNLSPSAVRRHYEIYENKAYSGDEAAQSLNILKKKIETAGYRVTCSIGNVKKKRAASPIPRTDIIKNK